MLSALGADTVAGFHWGMVVLSILTCLAAYGLARALAGPIAGLGASALLTVAPPFPLFAHRVLADIPPLGLALAGLWLAWVAQERRSTFVGGAAGALLALAVATKPNAILAVIPFVVLIAWDRGWWRRALASALAGAGAVAAVLLVVYADVLGELWESVVVYHRDARDTPDVIDKGHELLTFLNPRTPFAWAVVGGLVASVLLLRRRSLAPVWALWLWAAVSVAFLVYHHPLHYNHLLVLPVVLAVPAAVAIAALVERLPRRELVVAGLALVLVAAYAQQWRRAALDDIPEEPELVQAAEILRAETEPGALVVSDQPIVPFLAGRTVAGPLVDLAVLRFETRSLTDAEVLRVLEESDVRAVVVGRALLRRPQAQRGIRARYERAGRAGDVEVFVRR